jgi:hypothetical protein
MLKERVCQPDPDADIIPRRIGVLPNLYTVSLEDGLKKARNMYGRSK